MKKTLRERIAALAAMNVPALREEHRKLFGKDPASSHRQFLFRKIAWRLQADEEGWLPEQVRELARGIAQEITGTKWNGLLFFGLTEKKNGRG